MTDFWTKTETILREMEADEEYDLFAIGYVIPQVPLAHDQWDESQDPKQALLSYIEQSMSDDQISEVDMKLIHQVLEEALRHR
jgi:hypothetical protein